MSETVAPSAIIRSSVRTIETHYWATLFLLIALVPLLRAVGLPLKFSWTVYLVNYWLGLTAQSMCAVSILYVAGGPYSETLTPIFRHFNRRRARLLFLIPLGGIIVWFIGSVFAFVVIVDAVAIFEFVDRSAERPESSVNKFLDVLVPAAYFFVIFVMVFAYNDIIALRRYTGSWEFILNRADAFILGGHTVSFWADAVIFWSPKLVPVLHYIYFAMPSQVGAAIVILAWRNGRSAALKFVGTVACAYYIALFMFFWIPATGPYAIDPIHFSVLPKGAAVYQIQTALLARLDQLRLTHTKAFIGLDYFVGLPCMHLVQPLIVLWFLRKWKRMAAALIAYDLLMVPLILLLEWHYVVDLIAAVPVAALAISISGRDTGPNQAQHV